MPTPTHPCSFDFQYPPCGSSRCNLRAAALKANNGTLSVPSMRVESLQPFGTACCAYFERFFQYPPCGSSRCNTATSQPILLLSNLSVPSMRVESLQQHPHPPCPRSDRELSVPSMRVESLQRLRRGQEDRYGLPFSTLHAGRVAATPSAQIQSELVTCFQYPPCGSSRCNILQDIEWTLQRLFQYPPCGSSRCNKASFSRKCGEYRLSVPSMRVESLQLFSVRQHTVTVVFFQYPPCGSSRCN